MNCAQFLECAHGWQKVASGTPCISLPGSFMFSLCTAHCRLFPHTGSCRSNHKGNHVHPGKQPILQQEPWEIPATPDTTGHSYTVCQVMQHHYPLPQLANPPSPTTAHIGGHTTSQLDMYGPSSCFFKRRVSLPPHYFLNSLNIPYLSTTSYLSGTIFCK